MVMSGQAIRWLFVLAFLMVGYFAFEVPRTDTDVDVKFTEKQLEAIVHFSKHIEQISKGEVQLEEHALAFENALKLLSNSNDDALTQTSIISIVTLNNIQSTAESINLPLGETLSFLSDIFEVSLLTNLKDRRQFLIANDLNEVLDYENLSSLHDTSIYYANNETSMLAYRLVFNDEQIFIAFNFSWEIHNMPLPLGFMSSTKVTRWESDIRSVERFLTSNPLTIRPFTAVIVKV